MRAIPLAGATLVVLGLAGCNTALPPNTLVERAPVFAPAPVYGPPPVAYAPPPPRCFYRDGPYGPERICRRSYY